MSLRNPTGGLAAPPAPAAPEPDLIVTVRDLRVWSAADSAARLTSSDDVAVVRWRAAEGLHLDQEHMLEHLRAGPQSWTALRRRLDVLTSDTRPSETRRQLAELVDSGLIDEFEDSKYRLTAAGFAAADWGPPPGWPSRCVPDNAGQHSSATL